MDGVVGCHSIDFCMGDCCAVSSSWSSQRQQTLHSPRQLPMGRLDHLDMDCCYRMCTTTATTTTAHIRFQTGERFLSSQIEAGTESARSKLLYLLLFLCGKISSTLGFGIRTTLPSHTHAPTTTVGRFKCFGNSHTTLLFSPSIDIRYQNV
jgi:hypothetical protein